MADMMKFPNTVEEFMEQYKITDTEQIYTNGAEFVPVFRMEQWFKHQADRMKFVQETVNTIMNTSKTDSIKDKCFRNAARFVQNAIDGKPRDYERIPDEPERKTGKWVKVHGGYFTPGGDPVWVCSECGKGIHVYGIEHGSYGRDVADGQWKACPNCGARMEEGDLND